MRRSVQLIVRPEWLARPGSPKRALVRPDPFFVDKLLAQLKQSKPDGAPRPDMVVKQVNSVGNRDRLAGRRFEMGRHTLQ